MDGLTAALVAVVVVYALRAKESRERIQLLGQHLQALQVERLLEQLHTGYQRALNEKEPGPRELIWQQLAPLERQLGQQVSALASAFADVPEPLARISKWSGTLPYASRWLPQSHFSMLSALQIHAQGLSETASNAEALSHKQKAFRMLAEMLLFQHTCHWFCKSHSVATARMVLRHQTSPEQAVQGVRPSTRAAYLALTESIKS